MNTIFKKIIDREVPANIIYEDEQTVVFLDIHPIRKGHALVIPRHPYVNIFDIDEATFGHMARVARKIAHALVQVTKAKGINIHMNNGDAAGQDVPHAHMHVIPRFARGEAFNETQHETYDDNEAEDIAQELRRILSGT